MAGRGLLEDCDNRADGPAKQVLSGVRPWAVDKAAAEALWILSEKLTAVRLERLLKTSADPGLLTCSKAGGWVQVPRIYLRKRMEEFHV